MTGILLVTGGAGFIGSRVVQAARREGWRVRVLDSFRRDVHGVEVVRGDVADRGAVDAALDGVDAVCHLAAKVGLGVDFSDAPDYAASNVLATAQLLAAMAATEVRRLVLASSMVVYGEGAYRDSHGRVAAPPRAVADLRRGEFEPRSPRTGEPLIPDLVREDDAVDPRNVYALTKLAQEHLATAWARETGGRAAMLRYHNVYGPGMPRDTPYAGVAALFRSRLEAGLAPLVFEDGCQRRDFVHVDDVASATVAAVGWTARVTGGEGPASRAFNVASGEVRTIGELAAAIAAARGGPAPITTGDFRLGDIRHVTASADRIRAELGWRPRVAFADGVRRFALEPMRDAAAVPVP